MDRFKNEIENIYGNWTVISKDERRFQRSTHDKVFWICRCKCGTEHSFRSDYLRTLDKDACCKKCKQIPNEIDETGNIFGLLTVLHKDEEKSKTENGAWWVCQCICGVIVSCAGCSLRKTKKHCGSTIHTRTNLEGKIYNQNILVIKDEYTSYVRCKCILCGTIFEHSRNGLQHVTSCGCVKRKIRHANEVGKRYGNLTVLRQIGYRLNRKNTKTKILWECLCDCGKTCVKEGTSLRLGRVDRCLTCSKSINVFSAGYVYLMRGVGGYYENAYKIGLSTNVQKRKAQLNYNSISSHITLINSMYVSNMKKVEKHFHDKYSCKRMRGEREWFYLSKEDVAYIDMLFSFNENEMCQIEQVGYNKTEYIEI